MKYTNYSIINEIIENKNDKKILTNSNFKFNENELYISIDWLQFTLKYTNFNTVLDFLNLTQTPYTIIDSAIFGYNKTYVFFEKVKIMARYDYLLGEEKLNEEMGFHVLLSGKGCREIEQKINFQDLFIKLYNYGITGGNKCNITRIDYAIDYFTKNIIYIKKLVRELKKGYVTSRFTKAYQYEGIDINDGSTLGQTLYYGSPTSEIRFVFYDKLQERTDAGYQVKDYVNFWERCELRLRGNKSLESIKYLNEENFNIGQFLSGLIINYIQYRIPSSDSNKNRWPIADYWKLFTNNIIPVRLSRFSVQSSLQNKKDYVLSHWTSLINEIFIAEYENRDQFIKELISSNAIVSNERLERINQYRISKGQSILTEQQVLDIIHTIQSGISLLTTDNFNSILNNFDNQ